jgi:hypothetical protein
LEVPVDSLLKERGTLRFLDDKAVPYWTLGIVGSSSDDGVTSEYFGDGLVRKGKPIDLQLTVRGPVKTCSDLLGREIGFNTDYSPDGSLTAETG